MSTELFISLLSSTIILLLCIFLPFVVGGVLISKIWDLIDDPLEILIKRTVAEKEGRVVLRHEYQKATEPYSVELIDNHPDPYQDGRNYYRKLSIEEAKTKKLEVEKAKAAFDLKYPDFFSELNYLKRSQKFPRLFLTSFSWIIGAVMLFSTTGLFYLATGYFGVNISIQSYKQVELEQQAQDEITKTLIGDLGSIAAELSKPRQLTIEQIEKITDKLPPAVSKLQSNLEQTDIQMRELQESLQFELEELEVQKEKFDTVRALSSQEFEAVKTILFEETEKSTRRYYLIGLFSSIPIFWLSEILKALFLNWFRQLKFFELRRSEQKNNPT